MTAANVVFQYSPISALAHGLATHGLPLSELLSQGNHGLGTLKYMRGEMIIYDGEAYQMREDGTVQHLDHHANNDDHVVPFAMVTHFQADATQHITFTSKKDLSDQLTRLFTTAKNHFLSIQIRGTLKSLTVRNVSGQRFPGECLRDVAGAQSVQTVNDVKGTVVGFRSPQNMADTTIAGDHWHFIDDGKTLGGHILDMESSGEVELLVARSTDFRLQLPSDPEFEKAELQTDQAVIKAVEG